MAKKVVGLIKLQCPAGKANPAPSRAGSRSIRCHIMGFCKEFNERTASQAG